MPVHMQGRKTDSGSGIPRAGLLNHLRCREMFPGERAVSNIGYDEGPLTPVR